MFHTAWSTTPVKYYYTKSTVLVDPDGNAVEWTALRPDLPVTYTYFQAGDRMVLTNVTLAAVMKNPDLLRLLAMISPLLSPKACENDLRVGRKT